MRARLVGIDEGMEEAAADLYAPPFRRFMQVTLPLMWPAVLAGLLLSFSLSLDDTIISAFVSVAGSTPWPVFVLSATHSTLRPDVAAASTLMLVMTLSALAVTGVVLLEIGTERRRCRGDGCDHGHAHGNENELNDRELRMRMEFEVLDLAGVSNVKASDLPRTPLVAGDLRLRGIPFAIGTPSKGEHRYLGLGEELKAEPVEIAIDRPASHLLFAFSMLDSPLRAGGPFGYPCMELTIKTAAAEHHVTVREGFDNPARFRRASSSSRCWRGRTIGQHGATPRRSVVSTWGMRQMEVEIPHPQDFYLWAWKNPARDDRVVSLRSSPNDARFIIGGITVGDLDEEPFGQSAARTVRLELLERDRRTVGTALGTGRSRSRWLCLAAPAPHPGGVPRRDGRMGRTGGR